MAIDTPKKVRMNEDKLPMAQRRALDDLRSLVNGQGLPIIKIREHLDVLDDHCGNESVITLSDDEYYGAEASFEWSRYETEAEVTKRIETNRKRQITREAKRGEDAVKRLDKDRAELARLQALYPEGVPS